MEIDNKLNFSLVSPSSLLFSSKVWMVTLPGEEGDMGVLFGHAPVLSTIRPGLVSIFLDESSDYTTELHFFVDRGFIRIDSAGCTVLAEDIVNISDLNIKDMESNMQKLSMDMSKTDSVEEHNTLKHKIDSINKRIEVLKSLKS
jgi:F-type H+-transporting ATPase subunit epsilon